MIFLIVFEDISKIEKWFEIKECPEFEEIPTCGRDFFLAVRKDGRTQRDWAIWHF
jgi:hypothetical protein